MTNCIYAVRDAMQAADSESMVDSVLSQPQVHQLRPRNHPMLPLRRSSNVHIEAFTLARAHAKPSQPAYIAG